MTDIFDDEDRTRLYEEENNRNGTGNPNAPKHRSTENLQSAVNPVERAAAPLIDILIQVKNSASHPAPEQLRTAISSELETFRSTVTPLVKTPQNATMASYVLCTAIDEAAMNTPWGHNSNWAQNSLLSSHHGEVRGGERFFELLKQLGADARQNINLLELMYLCLALGYEGVYKVKENGQETLERVRKWLYENIRSVRESPPQALSQHWAGADIDDRDLPVLTPIWVILAAAASIAALVYFLSLTNLGSKTQHTVSTFHNLSAPPLIVIAPPPLPVRKPDAISKPTLSELLADEIGAGELVVFESPEQAVVRLTGDNLFGSGRANIDNSAIPLLARTARAIDEFHSTVLVIGHTDNIPIRRVDFPSNLDLSQARAESVATIVGNYLRKSSRLIAEGVGELEPLNDNSSRELRAKNRRVEITVYY